jgi:metal-sulfur cluster biosynthetic enzyme
MSTPEHRERDAAHATTPAAPDPAGSATPPAARREAVSRADLWEALARVEDPELGVDIVNLGLVRDVMLEGPAVGVLMTLTSIGCPVQDDLELEVKNILSEVLGVQAVQVAFTFEPPWSPSDITEDGRDQLLALGYL